MIMMGRIMAVDPGEVRIGLALSDPTETISRPHKVILHRSRQKNAERILREAEEHSVERIIVGVALDARGELGPQARKAMRLVEALREQTDLPIETWDESGSTQFVIGKKRKNRPLDDLAAAHILQEYLDAEKSS